MVLLQAAWDVLLEEADAWSMLWLLLRFLFSAVAVFVEITVLSCCLVMVI